jgi:hypothetical protein
MKVLLIAALSLLALWLVQTIAFLLGYRHNGRSPR